MSVLSTTIYFGTGASAPAGMWRIAGAEAPVPKFYIH